MYLWRSNDRLGFNVVTALLQKMVHPQFCWMMRVGSLALVQNLFYFILMATAASTLVQARLSFFQARLSVAVII